MASRQYLNEQLKKLKGSLDNFIKPQLLDSLTSHENLNTKSVKKLMYGCNIVGDTDNNNKNCECESIEYVAQVVDTEVVNVTDVEQIANARVNELNLKNEHIQLIGFILMKILMIVILKDLFWLMGPVDQI
ncbi:hypothetical protein QTP88_005894 [Uroleucon formosanum]